MGHHIQYNEILIFSMILFFIGVYGVLTRRNLIAILMSLEIMLNSININFVTINKYIYPDKSDGLFMVLFIITIAAAEVALAIAIFYQFYQFTKNIDIDNTKDLKF